MSQQLEFVDFLKKPKDELLQMPIVCFTRSIGCPILFFLRAFQYLKASQTVPIQAVSCQSFNKQQVLSQLETSFLGETTVCWLRDLPTLNIREQSFWYDYCARYDGPNGIWFFIQDNKSKDTYPITVSIPAAIDKSLFSVLSSFFDIALTMRNKQFINQLFTKRSTIELDMACLLLEYMQLVGSDNKTFFANILSNLVPSDESLFALSTAFLAKKSALFFAKWQQLETQYSEQFWCSFFSDLLWRGSQYIRLARKNDMVSARKIAYRLPFSFIKSDWRKLSHQELIAAHSFIYDADFRFKNSNGYAAFDLFFSTFFLNSFDE